jgi:hypothetical protein
MSDVPKHRKLHKAFIICFRIHRVPSTYHISASGTTIKPLRSTSQDDSCKELGQSIATCKRCSLTFRAPELWQHCLPTVIVSTTMKRSFEDASLLTQPGNHRHPGQSNKAGLDLLYLVIVDRTECLHWISNSSHGDGPLIMLLDEQHTFPSALPEAYHHLRYA